MASDWSRGDSPAPIIVYDGDGRVVDANPAALTLLGLERDDLVGTYASDSDWLILEGGGEAISVHPVIAALKSRQPLRGVLARARRPDGTDVWLQIDALPIESDGVASGGATAILTDVTYLVTRSRVSRRSGGDHIVDAVTDSLAQSRMEPRAILTTVTRALSKLRPGIWVASLMGKDPANMQIVVANAQDDDGFYADYASAYNEAMRMAGAQNTAPIASRVIESGEPLVMPDVSMEQLMAYMNDEVRAYLTEHPWLPPAASFGLIVVPMRARGATIGALHLLEGRTSNPLTEKDALWMQAIADRTGLAVENAQLYDDAVRRLERLAALQSVSLAVSASPDITLTLKVIIDHVTSQLKVDAADVLLLDESDNTLFLAASDGFLSTAVPDYRLPADEGLPGRGLSSRRIETVTALSAFSQFRRRSLFAREGFKAYGAVPLISRGKLLGALEVFHRSNLNPDQEWASFLDALGSVAAVAIDNATMHERLRHARAGTVPRAPTKPPPQMSRVETEIMRLVVAGMTNREIAAQVHLSQNTIKFHMRQILQKTGAANRTELAHQAAKEGWL